MKNYADRRGCYSPRLKAQVDNILRDQHNSSHHTKAEFNNCLLFIQNIFKFLISLPSGRLSSKLWPSAQFQNNYKHRYFFADTPQKVDSIY